MAGEENYIHPIIQAIMQGQNLAQSAHELSVRVQNQKAAQENAKRETDIRQQLADQEEKRIKGEQDYREAMLKINHDNAQAELAMHGLQATNIMREMIQNGVDPSAFIGQMGGSVSGEPAHAAVASPLWNQGYPGAPATPDTRMINLPGLNLNIPAAALGTPQSAMELEMAKARGLAQATAEGKEPSLIADEARKAQTAKDLKKMEIEWAERKENMDKKTQLQLENIRVGPEYERNKLEYGMTPEAMQAGVDGYLTGDFLPTQQDISNPKLSRVYTATQGMGGKFFTSKDQQNFVNNATRIEGVLRDLDAVNSSLPDEKQLGAGGATVNAALIQKTYDKLPTDLKNKMSELQLQIPTIMKTVQQTPGNRLNSNDIELINKGLAAVKTKQQGQDYANHLRAMYNDNINNLEQGMPMIQQNRLWQKKGLTPAWAIQAQQSPDGQQHISNGNTLDIDRSIEKGFPQWSSVNN